MTNTVDTFTAPTEDTDRALVTYAEHYLSGLTGVGPRTAGGRTGVAYSTATSMQRYTRHAAAVALFAGDASETLLPRTLVQLAGDLHTDAGARDAVLSLAVGDDAVAARRLWWAMAEAVPAPLRAVPLTLLAAAAYADGVRGRARLLVDGACEADPGNVLAQLLDSALRMGVGPSIGRTLVETGAETLAEMADADA